MGMGTGPMAHLKELGLTEQQRDRIEAIHDTQRRGGIELRKDLELAQLDMQKLMRADAPDRRAIETHIDRIAGLRAQLHKARVNTMLDVRSVLTPQQRQKLEQLRERGPQAGAERGPAPRGPSRQGGTRGQ
jgi:Spy/CpxP family protein refolding chaperone